MSSSYFKSNIYSRKLTVDWLLNGTIIRIYENADQSSVTRPVSFCYAILYKTSLIIDMRYSIKTEYH